MAGTLYLVATPIGNLDDMPPRVAATFGAVDFIAAEDTRVTLRLLNHLGLKKPLVSYYEHALQKGEGILRRIEAGESCALCSDAGMPCISDPGEVIVRDALAAGRLARLHTPDCQMEMHRQLFYHRDKWLTPQMKRFIALVKEA